MKGESTISDEANHWVTKRLSGDWTRFGVENILLCYHPFYTKKHRLQCAAGDFLQNLIESPSLFDHA